MTNATCRTKTLILARLDEVIVKGEELRGFFFRHTFTVRLEELKELREQLHRLDTLGEIADLLISEDLFDQLTETNR